MNDPKILVYYPGHLGAEPVTTLRGGIKAVRWVKGKRVLLPRADALGLIRQQGFLEAEPLAACAARTGLSQVKLRQVARVEGKGAEAVVVLDVETRRALRGIVVTPHPTAEPGATAGAQE